MARCNRPDCGRGDVDFQGFCSACSRRPLPPSAPEAGRATPAGQSKPAGPVPGPQADRARPEPWWGLDLVDAGSVPDFTDEPADVELTVPEERRFCANGHPVGRAHDGKPGRVKGFCPHCLDRFDFTRSRVGGTIAGRYDVKRMLGAGGFGTALLARDRNLGTDVVLKDLSQSIAKTAHQERDALLGLRHDSIVRIYGYEPEGPYLVLEYVRGKPLSARADDRLEVILAHSLQILQALDYLHARDLLHMDVKPSNIIRFGDRGAGERRDRVRLIDFGAVRTREDQGSVDIYTAAYAPPKADPEHKFPTAGFDLFCLAKTLRELCHRHLPDPAAPGLPDPAAPGVLALDRLLKRATDTRTPERRFVSARQFAEQLSGVIRQVGAASPATRRVTRPSAIFGSMTEPLHGGLGAPRPLDHWVTARVGADQRLTMVPPFAAPAPADAVAALPAPLTDPDDPGMTRACESQLAACRTALRNGDLKSADSALDETRLPGWSWIRAWYGGLIALVRGDASAAAGHFGTVCDELPGELIPLFALGLCAEIRGRPTQARQYFETVADTAPALGAAGFGLARTYLREGQRGNAVLAAERLAGELQARELRAEQEARIAVVRLLAAVADSCVPAEEDLTMAQSLADGLPGGDGQQTRLRAEIQYGRSAVTGDWLALSEMIPDLAKLAVTRQDFFAMIDHANRLRPPVEWWWQRGFRRNPHESRI